MPSLTVKDTVNRLTSRAPGRTEADVQSLVASLLLAGDMNLDPSQVVKLEAQLADGTGRRIDVEVGQLLVEVKKDLRVGQVLINAEDQLNGYLAQREAQLGVRFAGILTDGSDWRLYRRDGNILRHVTTLKVTGADDGDALIAWLESILATREEVKPTPSAIEDLLGAGSPAHKFDHAILADLLENAAGDSGVALKRELWAKLLRTAFGEGFVDDNTLFINHTLLVITAEAIAHAIIGFDIIRDLTPTELVTGSKFSDAQILNVVEEDFFDWVLALPDGQKFVSDLARRVARFDWSAVEHDVLKVLYESVIDHKVRESLGEYYTPDWLAEEMVADTVTDPLVQRVMDPSCGSGTFLFHAVRRYVNAAEAGGASSGEAVSGAAEHVLGMDIHPVAVTFARVTYLLALGTQRLNHRDRGAVTIPVFLGDTLQWERHRDLFTDDDAIKVSTAGEDLIQGGGGAIFGDDLTFPISVARDAAQFDQLVRAMGDKVTSAATFAAMNPILRKFGILAGTADATTLQTTFDIWLRLRQSGRDHIWSYYVRNLARPLWLAREQVDVLVGNPPWLRYSKMLPNMQARYQELAGPRNLLTGGLGASARDLSTLFVVRAIELYLKKGGGFAFIMPFGTLSRRPHTGFRSADWRGDDSATLTVEFDVPWDTSDINMFPYPSCVVRGTLSVSNPVSLSPQTLHWVGPTRNGPAHIDRGDAVTAIHTGDSYASLYSSIFRQGAIIVPRMLLFADRTPAGPLSVGAGRVAVKSHRSSQEKDPWKKLPDIEGIVEEGFLRQGQLAADVAPFRDLGARDVVLPLALDHVMTATEVAAYPALSGWWEKVETVWTANCKPDERQPLLTRFDFHGQLSAQLPIAEHRVVYTASGGTLHACRLEGSKSVIEHSLYWAPTESRTPDIAAG
jgi:hypothetical protein